MDFSLHHQPRPHLLKIFLCLLGFFKLRLCSSRLYFEKLDESTSVACSRSRLQHTASSKLNILVKMPNVIWRPGGQTYLSDACELCAQYWMHMYVLVKLGCQK